MSDASIDGRREQGQPDRQETAPLDRSIFEFFEYVQSEDASSAFWRAERGTANAEPGPRNSSAFFLRCYTRLCNPCRTGCRSKAGFVRNALTNGR